jgi:D-alanyl-D-alanine carboxypeptidase
VLTRRRLLALAAVSPLLGALPARAATPDLATIRDWVRAGLDRGPGVFGLSPEVAHEVLLPATREDALPDGYVPPDLISVAGGQRIRALIVDDTRALIGDAASAGLDLYVGSGYRSQAYQASVFRAQTARWGDPETANRYSARPGHSQHQLGTTIDFTISFRGFRESEAPQWLRDNAHRFGFVLPYTAAATERTGYVDEPWHARWVGPLLATALHAAGYHDWTDLDADDVIAVVRTEAGI